MKEKHIFIEGLKDLMIEFFRDGNFNWWSPRGTFTDRKDQLRWENFWREFRRNSKRKVFRDGSFNLWKSERDIYWSRGSVEVRIFVKRIQDKLMISWDKENICKKNLGWNERFEKSFSEMETVIWEIPRRVRAREF